MRKKSEVPEDGNEQSINYDLLSNTSLARRTVLSGLSATGLAGLTTATDEEWEKFESTDRVESLLREMTIEEKVGQLNQLSVNFTTGTGDGGDEIKAAIEAGKVGAVLNAIGIESKQQLQELAVEKSRLGIPLLMGYDVIHGFRTIFPIPLAQAASWDPALAERVDRIAATEAAAAGHNWTFAPMLDVSRDPRWGRVMEGFGEDPHLGSEFARARVRGFQGDDLAATDTLLACAKHFVGYGAPEGGRDYNTPNISETALRERHLPAFKAAVDAGVRSVMNAFNVYDRIPASGNKQLVRDILKGVWEFDGVMVSDWNSFAEQIPHGTAADRRDAARLAMQAGSDIDMVSEILIDELPDLVADGVVSESRLNDAVRRVLLVKESLGLLEDPYRYIDADRKADVILADEHRRAAREAARDSFVLLQNEDDRLPLNPDTDIALIGALADNAGDALGGWSASGKPEDVVTVREGLSDYLGTDVPYAAGYSLPGEVTDSLSAEAVAAAKDADVAVVTVGETADVTGEAASRARIGLPGDQRQLVEALVETNTPVVVLLMNGRPLTIEWLDEHASAILDIWHPGIEGGPAVAETLFGDTAPSGRLPMTFPITEGQIPLAHNHLPTGRPTEEGNFYTTGYLDVPNEPLYAFGHGKSYTEFIYDDVALSTTEVRCGDKLTVGVTISNSGDVAAAEVVQLYVRDLTGSRSRPVQELIGFEKIHLEPGETASVAIDVTTSDLELWTADDEWATEPGEFDLLIGHASDDIRFTERFELIE